MHGLSHTLQPQLTTHVSHVNGTPSPSHRSAVSQDSPTSISVCGIGRRGRIIASSQPAAYVLILNRSESTAGLVTLYAITRTLAQYMGAFWGSSCGGGARRKGKQHAHDQRSEVRAVYCSRESLQLVATQPTVCSASTRGSRGRTCPYKPVFLLLPLWLSSCIALICPLPRKVRARNFGWFVILDIWCFLAAVPANTQL